MVFKQIGTYQVQYASNTFLPRIWLKDTSGSAIGQLVFKSDGTVLPPDTPTDLHYHVSHFSRVIDLLRNESPVYWNYVGSGPGFENALRTGEEKPGEGES